MALTQDRARLGHRGELHLRAADAVSKAAKRFDIEPPKLEATDAADRAAVRPLSAPKSAVGNPYVFPGSLRGRRRARDKAPGLPTFNSFSKARADLDKKLADVPHWTLHDLRRTARSLMSKAGVRPDIAERVLGRAIVGVEGVYDRHDYADEKAEALKQLASQVEIIINPPEGNVVPLRR